jgi:hypothetical protein
MSADNSVEITLLFEKARNGDELAENRLAKLLTPELRRIASVHLGRDFRGDSMESGRTGDAGRSVGQGDAGTGS